MRKCLRVRFYDDEKHVEVASSVQLVLPDGMGVSEARDYLVWTWRGRTGVGGAPPIVPARLARTRSTGVPGPGATFPPARALSGPHRPRR